MPLLVEPDLDADSLARDHDLARALDVVLNARLAAPAAQTPDAEAVALRTFLVGNGGFRQASILRAVWGRLTAASSPPFVACGPAAQQAVADRYGLPVRLSPDPEAALAEAQGGARAVIDIETPRPWWGRLLARPDLRVIGALPDDTLGLPRALVVSLEASGPTGDDRTFWITDSAMPDAKLVEAMAAIGLVAYPLIAAGGLKLMVLAGYVQANDGRLSAAPGALKGVIGAAPVY